MPISHGTFIGNWIGRGKKKESEKEEGCGRGQDLLSLSLLSFVHCSHTSLFSQLMECQFTLLQLLLLHYCIVHSAVVGGHGIAAAALPCNLAILEKNMQSQQIFQFFHKTNAMHALKGVLVLDTMGSCVSSANSSIEQRIRLVFQFESFIHSMERRRASKNLTSWKCKLR